MKQTTKKQTNQPTNKQRDSACLPLRCGPGAELDGQPILVRGAQPSAFFKVPCLLGDVFLRFAKCKEKHPLKTRGGGF